MVEDPIYLFGQFVSTVSLDALNDSKLQKFVRDLCLKAPSVAGYLAQEILNYPKDNFQPEFEGSQELELSTTIKPKRKRKKPSDRSYRPKPSRIQSHIPRDGDGVSHESPSVSSQVGDELLTCQSSDDMTVPEFEEEIPQTTTEKVPQDDPLVHGGTLSPIANESTLQQLQATFTNDSLKTNIFQRQPSVALGQAAVDDQTTSRPSSPNAMEPGDPALPEIDKKGSDPQTSSETPSPHVAELHGTTFPDPTPSTPAGKMSRGFQSPISDDPAATPQIVVFTPIVNGGLSPLTEDDWSVSPPEKIEMSFPEECPTPSCTEQQQTSLCSAASTKAQPIDREKSLPTQNGPAMPPPPPPGLADMVANAVDIIYEMARRHEVPTEVHSRILTTIQPGLGGTPATDTVGRPDSVWITSSPTTWSASMWISMLEAGRAGSKEKTILNMIEWMGASMWYDAELEQAEKAPSLTKRGKRRKRLATVVLDNYLHKAHNTTALEGPGKLTSKDNEDLPLSLDLAGIQKSILSAKRRRLIKDFHRGRTLRNLVRMTHLGILFDPHIWSFVKASKEEVEKIAAHFQADPQKMELLSILDEQVKLLAEKGRPDPSRFLDSLESHSLAPLEVISNLRADYGFEKEPVPQGCLDTAINRTVERISHVLGKHLLSEDDSVIVNGAVELPSGMFDRLRSREWLQCWDIMAALEMTDRPVFVQLGMSVPLHTKNSNGKVTPISSPFGRWRKEIDKNLRDMNDLERPQIFICPLNINTNHFTLLEINKQTEMIYHYDSMATKSTFVRQAVEAEFKDLGFGYIEAPTPQQDDGWSCGLMVIRNAKQRMNGLSVGDWNSEVNPDRVIKEVIGVCQMFLGSDALHPQPISKKRKKTTEEAPIRCSKRLRNNS